MNRSGAVGGLGGGITRRTWDAVNIHTCNGPSDLKVGREPLRGPFAAQLPRTNTHTTTHHKMSQATQQMPQFDEATRVRNPKRFTSAILFSAPSTNGADAGASVTSASAFLGLLWRVSATDVLYSRSSPTSLSRSTFCHDRHPMRSFGDAQRKGNC